MKRSLIVQALVLISLTVFPILADAADKDTIAQDQFCLYFKQVMRMVWPDERLSWKEYRGKAGDPQVEVNGAAYLLVRREASDSEA